MSATMEIVVLPRGKPLKKMPEAMNLPHNAPASDLYAGLAAATKTSIHRIRITKGSDGVLVPNSKDVPIRQTGLLDGSKIYVKDLGPQIAWRTVFLTEYVGPLLIHPLIYAIRPYIYSSPEPSSFPAPSTLQTLSLLLICLHYVKREYETLFVHRFSASTMPFRNIFKNSFHYWALSGLFIAYFIYGPTSATAGPIQPLVTYPGLLLFALGELGNLNCHLVLKGLRSSGGKERGIPHGLGFDLVTCPNYMFEAFSFIGFTMVTRSWAALIFTAISIGQMAIWGKKKERNYRKEFGDQYKRKAYCIMPGVY